MNYYPFVLRIFSSYASSKQEPDPMVIRNTDSRARQNWVQIQPSPFMPLGPWATY